MRSHKHNIFFNESLDGFKRVGIAYLILAILLTICYALFIIGSAENIEIPSYRFFDLIY